MPIVHAIVLGLTQGLSEFLPISSSGHLVLVRWLMGWRELNTSLAKTFDVALHLGTLLAVVAYFWRDVLRYLKAAPGILNKGRRDETDVRVAWALLISAIPGGLAGALFDNFIEQKLSKPVLIGIMLIVFAGVLYVADRMVGARKTESLTYRDAIIMGGAQALALQPGVSRAGSTMMAGRWLGFDRDSAARVSFLMSIPVIGGAVAFKALHVIKDGIPSNMVAPFIVGIVGAALSGALAIGVLLRVVRSKSFTPFVAYRALAGAGVLIVAATHWR